MDPAQSHPILDRLRWIADAKKGFDAKPTWTTIEHRASARLDLVVALRLGGVLRGGVSMRLQTPRDVWEEDVYGHIEVRFPDSKRALRLNPIEWRPLRHHDNPPTSPPAHRGQRLLDRWLPFHFNQRLGLGAFDQSVPGIAVPLPRAPNSFLEYTDLCSDLWHLPDMMGLAPPPWARRMDV